MIGISTKHQKLKSRTDGFNAHFWDNTHEKEILELIKKFSINIYKDAGYSEYETVNLDDWSKWFYVTYDGEIQAACRLVEKTKDNLIPLEIVERFPSRSHYNIINENVADWNSVSFNQTILGAQAFKIAATELAQYCLNQKFSVVYGLINPTWKGLQRVYFDNGATFSKEYSDMVYYPGCLLNGKLAFFKIIEIKENSLQNIASKM
ncbi:LBL_2463 family protein [Leptospira interrogans]|uniref:LBL_2463 family protein n=2 Tax=Leptospira interrogans TaxID=173 RepID=UPI0002BB3AA1|nr:hypothetical protein [Leptospira interrogans]OAM85881.1 hypothetical protein A1343_16570 [Leptospira interrogans serovar Bataviae]QOI40833.1 hypothetical protein Lepto1548_21600 [Leptospira interrogans serovar Bataviae]QYY62649.1 hypothetical protein GR153_019875 [Leptospira interrogans serovar Bataviae]